ncbi:MAG: FprA family A-type flavoprotein [Spirochaetaceae bacterium]|jgi:flavorubredoxin|nr:FprA family A-type flavoprotein [Spirochaetaceae bacterium]
MKIHTIADSVYCIPVDIRSTDLFEGIWPVPNGFSLNTYVVKGEKTALIDLVQDRPDAASPVETALADRFGPVDYLILNHLEPDHSGWLREFLRKNPRAQIIATAKGIDLVTSFYKIDKAGTALRAVKDGDALDLGGGKVLTFFEAPNIHWPETMFTWEASSGTLFSCDAFGSFGALGGRLFDDEFNDAEHQRFEAETLRYYANIVSSFSAFVERGVEKVSGLAVSCAAPSHGMVFRRNAKAIIDRYLRYAGYSKGRTEREIAVIWGSMYGNTKKGLDAVIKGIEKRGVPYTAYQVPNDNISYILAAAFKSAGLVLAMPTYEYAMFPPMAYVLDIFRRKHIYHKKVLRIGSWGWVGGAQRAYDAAIADLKWDSLDSYEWAGAPSAQDLAVLEERGAALLS